MGWGLVFAGVSAVSGLFNAVDESQANRKIIANLNEIKNYLKDLKKSVRYIKQQNKEILLKLNELPIRIRQIVDEIVQTALLEERYSDLDDVRENFMTLRRWRRVSIRSQEWQRYSAGLNYIFDYENRISRLFDLIPLSEFALCITRNRAEPLIILRLEQKIQNLDDLIDEFKKRIEVDLEKLLLDLNNINYISSHNLSEELDDFKNLVFTKVSDRTITERYFVSETYQHCTSGHRPGDGPDCHFRTRQVPRHRTVPDKKFHISRDNFVQKIGDQINLISQDILSFSQIVTVTNSLKNYRNLLSQKSIEEIIKNAKPLLFFDNDSTEVVDSTEEFDINEIIEFLEINSKENVSIINNEDDNESFIYIEKY